MNGQKTKVVHIVYANSRVPITISGQQVEEVANFTYHGSVIFFGQGCRAQCRLLHRQGICHVPTTSSLEFTRPLPTEQTLAPDCDRFCRQHVQNLEDDGSWTFSISNVFNVSSGSLTGIMLWMWKYTVVPVPSPSLWPKTVILWQPAQGKRKRGRPKITWRRTFMDHLLTVDIPRDEVAAADQSWWRTLVGIMVKVRIGVCQILEGLCQWLKHSLRRILRPLPFNQTLCNSNCTSCSIMSVVYNFLDNYTMV